MVHRSVMVPEVVEWLCPRPGGIFLDGTIGGGGHTEAILEASSPSGRVIGLDWDDEAVQSVRKQLDKWGSRVEVFHERFSRMDKVIGDCRVQGVDGVVLDLGWSSDQMTDGSRGLSVRQEGPLDMRLDRRQTVTAAMIVNESPEERLTSLFRELGGEPFSERIARAIVAERTRQPFSTTAQLTKVVARATPFSRRHGRRHVATKVFQALRMAVNHETEELRAGLDVGFRLLNERGRFVVISFHSGEDGMVKRTFREQGRVLTPKPIRPSQAECLANARARSAKLRVAERESRGVC